MTPALNGMDGIMVKKSLLDDIIVQDKSNAALEEDEVLSVIIDEINLIKDDAIRSFTRSVLVKSSLFWITPSSGINGSTPPDEAFSSGNTLHAKRWARVANHLCNSYNVTEEERDFVISACLLGGVTRFIEDSSGELIYSEMHPYTVSQHVVKCIEMDKSVGNDAYSSTLFITEDSVQTILRLIRCQKGPWSLVPETMPITYLDYIVHLADNISSNIYEILKDSELIDERWKTIK